MAIVKWRWHNKHVRHIRRFFSFSLSSFLFFSNRVHLTQNIKAHSSIVAMDTQWFLSFWFWFTSMFTFKHGALPCNKLSKHIWKRIRIMINFANSIVRVNSDKSIDFPPSHFDIYKLVCMKMIWNCKEMINRSNRHSKFHETELAVLWIGIEKNVKGADRTKNRISKSYFLFLFCKEHINTHTHTHWTYTKTIAKS